MEALAAPEPFSFILFGASGNLAKLKLYPALYVLALKKRIPETYAIVGYARTEMSEDEFRTLVADAIRKDMIEVNEAILSEFLKHVHYQVGAYDNEKDFVALEKRLTTIEKGWKNAVRVAYLSIPPNVIAPVLKNLCAGGVHDAKKAFRCIVEKPVGHDMKSFEEIRSELTGCLREDEIYLLDHYLGKEAVRNAYYLRFANPILERLFKNTLIHHVQLTAIESLGIEGRAGYFEHTGTFRDMVQSHLLMMLSLMTMRIRDTDELLAHSRAEALAQLYLPPATDLSEIVLQGQYKSGAMGKNTAVAYLEEKDVDPASRTNTYTALKLFSRESRWQGVPFYLRSGKRLHKKETRISIQFQEPRVVGEGSAPNRLHIILQGEAGMRIELQTKLGGTTPAFRPLVLSDPLVCVGDCLPEHGILILEAIHGRRNWFLSFEEVRTSWKLIDPVQAYLDKSDTPLYAYPAYSDGPKESAAWLAQDGLTWL